MKKSKKNKKVSKFRDKINMYDMIIASALDKDDIVIPEEQLDSRSLAIGFSCVASEKYVSKYYVISQFPDFVPEHLLSILRNSCRNSGVIIDFFTYYEPHKIDWDSGEMRNRLSVWRDYYNTEDEGTVFDYRDKKDTIDAKKRIILSTKYLNSAELDNRRTLNKAYFVVRITAKRDRKSILNMASSIHVLKEQCSRMQIKIKELRVNMLDWCRLVNPFSLIEPKELKGKIPRKILTDDIAANFTSIEQGKVGEDGIPLAMDIVSGKLIMHKFKDDPDAAENVLICGETGSGKSHMVMSIILGLLGSGMTGVIMDYEGDEYINLGKYISAANKDDVCIIYVGKNSEHYFDPCPIPKMTGNKNIDSEAKTMAMSYIKLMFQKMMYGDGGELTNPQTKILSTAIQRMYDSVGVTEDMDTWYENSKKLRLKMVYDELKEIVISKEMYKPDEENELHLAAKKIVDDTSIFFEEGELYGNTFGKPLSLEKIYRAKLIIFSFGVQGMATSVTDSKILSLKQISIAYVNTLISNYCKYVKKGFNFKVWEEGQRWLNVAGSADIIINEITGGRKRGDINFIITNDVASLLKEADRLGEALTLNIQHYFLGSIKKKSVREKFCNEFQLENIEGALGKIADTKVSNKRVKGKKVTTSKNNYSHAFIYAFNDGSTPIGRVELPQAISESKIFKKGK